MVPIINMEKTGQNIVALRKQAGLSVKDIQASLFHVTMDDIVVVENKAYLEVCA